MTNREFRKYLTEKRLEAIRAEVQAEKKPPTREKTSPRPRQKKA
jgi:hypothetical protein